MRRKFSWKTFPFVPSVAMHASRHFVAVVSAIQALAVPCHKWVEHLRSAGFVVKVNVVPDTGVYRAKAGIPLALGACHTAFVGGYAVEGHVPAADTQRLLAQKPMAKALVVPGMPQTSPGMDRPHGEAWDVLLLASDGSTKVFNSYPAK
jgi:hypothetical protein